MHETQKPLSPIHIFGNVQKYIEKISTAPLLPTIVKVNKDQANDLGNDEEIEFPFARVDTGFPESYDQLLFAIDFYDKGLDLAFSGGEGTWVAYEELGTTDREVSIALTNLLTVFSNGQLKILLTCLEKNDHIQAVEILYRAPHSSVYNAIATSSRFLPPKKLKKHILYTTLFANSAGIKEVDIDISKTQKLLLPSYVDEEIMNAIGRKNLIDLNEPLLPENLELCIDNYAEKAGERASVKINQKLDTFDKSIGAYGMSTWELFVHFARWRHIELMVWGFAMLAAYHWVTWTIADANPIIWLIGISLIPIYLFRKRYPYPQILYIFAPIGYMLFAIGTVLFLQNFTPHWITWTIAIFALLSIAENIFLDIYSIRQKILDKMFQWTRR